MAVIRDIVHHMLRQWGMTTIFGNPGSTELGFLQDFPSDLNYVLTLHEAVAVHAAHGHALATGRPALVNLHSGPGLGNAMGAILAAKAGRAPLVITAGQQTRRLVTMEALLTNADATTLPRPAVKWAFEPPRPQDVPAALARARHLAMQPPQGPVFLSLPADDWDVEGEDPAPLTGRCISARSVPAPGTLAALADRLDRARRPVLVLGSGLDSEAGRASAVHLAERTRTPVWTAPSQGRSPFPEDHPHYQGVLRPAAPLLCQALAEHDLILVVGAPVFRHYLDLPGPLIPPGSELVLLTDDPDEAARAPVGDAVLADPALTLTALADLAAPGGHRPLVPRRPAAAPPTDRADQILDCLAHLSPDTVIVNESPSTLDTFWNRVTIRRAGGYYTSPDGGLGFGLAAAVGIQLADPTRPVIAVIGDGSAQYSITALWTAAALRLPLTVLVLRNDRYAVLDWYAQLTGRKMVPGLTIPGLDHLSLARGYGATAHQVVDLAALPALLHHPVSEKRPKVLVADL
ncbi:benzoylformate decarboxylase [Streptomyces sp. NPDC087422]|uniref:benzoylformate decarboxylase n=1 Tax=Streptomyces sp. NPDC087422 TaxID=3365786 RepID=UPI003805EAE7